MVQTIITYKIQNKGVKSEISRPNAQLLCKHPHYLQCLHLAKHIALFINYFKINFKILYIFEGENLFAL